MNRGHPEEGQMSTFDICLIFPCLEVYMSKSWLILPHSALYGLKEISYHQV